jgi:hypothetical protein
MRPNLQIPGELPNERWTVTTRNDPSDSWNIQLDRSDFSIPPRKVLFEDHRAISDDLQTVDWEHRADAPSGSHWTLTADHIAWACPVHFEV